LYKSVNVGIVWRGVFQDKRWPQKIGGLVLLGCIPGLNVLAWVGYQQSIAYNIAHDHPTPLPSWDNWADILVRGLITVSASGIYWLPVAALLVFGLFPGLRLLMFVALVAACAICLTLSIGHIRYARSDYSGIYGWAGWRTALSKQTDSSVSLMAYGISFIAQTAVIALAALLTPLALLTFIGPMILWSAVSIINGYILGQTAAQGRLASPK
jgi:hypothetical protein